MKKKLFFTLLSLFVFFSSFADLPFRNQRRDMFRTLPVNNQSIVFMGNSITQGNEWAETFSNDPRVINRGISGNTSAEILNNLDYVVGGKPAKIFLKIGINDGADPAIVVPIIRQSIDLIQKESPATEIYIQGLLPYNGNINVFNTNNMLKDLCVEKEVTYIDTFARLGGSESNLYLSSAYTNDNLHLLASGYYKWTEGYEEYTGIATSLPNQSNVTISNAHHAYVNQRTSLFAALPKSDNDILFLGDFNIETAEWREILRNPNVKNRGIGVNRGGTSISLIELKNMVPKIIQGNPSKIFISCGFKDVEFNGQTTAQAKKSYEDVIEAIRNIAPTTPIYIQSLVPSINASVNTDKYIAFNTEIASLENAEDNIHFIDVYSALVNGNVLNSAYSFGNGGLNGRGYLKWASVLAPFVDPDIQPVNINSYELNLLIASVRQAVYNAKAPNTAGGYAQEDIDNLREALNTASDIAQDPNVSESEIETAKNNLNSAFTALKGSEVTMPKLSDSNNEYWYKLSAPLRVIKYMTSTGAGNGVISTSENNFKKQQWKFTLRTDGNWNIINREDGSYMNPASANNTQILTSESEPANGWKLLPADDLSKFIIVSGSVQLNVTNFTNNMVYNWGSGNNKTDLGCQVLISEVTQEPDEEPIIESPNPFYAVTDVSCDGTAPVIIDATEAQSVLSKESLTVAIDFTPTTATGNSILVAASNADVDNKYFGIVTRDNFTRTGVQYVGDNNLEGWYTQTYSSPMSRHQLVITMIDGMPNYNYYMDGTFLRNVSGMGAYGYHSFGTIPNASLCLCGVVSLNDDNRYPFNGKIHSVQFFEGVLSAADVANINYENISTSNETVKSSSDELAFIISNKSVVAKGDAKISVYDISGRSLSPKNLVNGYYIVVADGVSHKIVIR